MCDRPGSIAVRARCPRGLVRSKRKSCDCGVQHVSMRALTSLVTCYLNSLQLLTLSNAAARLETRYSRGPHDPRSGSQGAAQLHASRSALVGNRCSNGVMAVSMSDPTSLITRDLSSRHALRVATQGSTLGTRSRAKTRSEGRFPANSPVRPTSGRRLRPPFPARASRGKLDVAR